MKASFNLELEMRLLAVVGVCLCVGSIAEAGVLVTRSEKGFVFAEAFDLTVNGKDKLLNLGTKPALAGEKLPQTAITGTLVKDANSGTVAQLSPGSVEYLIPRVNLKNGPGSPAEIWKAAAVSYRTAPKDKTTAEVSMASFSAYLPGGLEELMQLCRDERAMELIGGKGKGFETQMAMIDAVAGKYKTEPAIAPLSKYVEESMRQRLERFQTGTAGVDVLSEGLRFAQLSASAYPADPEQAKLRKSLADLKTWLDRKVAVLNAFSSTAQWDPFLIASRDFAIYQEAFPGLETKHTLALTSSLKSHQSAGEEDLKASEYGPAYREFRVALARNPVDEALQQRVVIAWTDYSRQLAIDQKGNRKQLSAGQIEALNQALLFASRYKEEGKLDLAYKKIQEAESIDPDALTVLLKKADVLGAQGNFTQALTALDAYDKLAVDDERQKASQLRNELLFKRTSLVEDARTQFQTAWGQRKFLHARDIALAGLRAKDDDPELLFSAGAAGMATGHADESRKCFLRYLEVSDTLAADAKKCALARRLMAVSAPIKTPPQTGVANWMSGFKLPPGLQYDPVSLAFQGRISHIEASGKMKVAYEWKNGRLLSISPSWEKPDQATGEKRVLFAYNDATGQLAKVSLDEKIAGGTWTPDEWLAQSDVVVLNNPYVDPVAIERLTGKSIAVTVAGNPYFEPFVWSKICYFQLTYDSQGRVAQARQLTEFGGSPADNLVEFEWQGMQLMAVRAYQMHGSEKALAYTRTMQYENGELVSEEIGGQGKGAHIKYKYASGQLVSATCDKDASLDSRSRQVSFQ
jgi:hypothetical protein